MSDKEETENPALDEARKRGLITPFVPGTVIDKTSFVVDKNGVGWWIMPGSMTIIQAGPPRPVRLTVIEDTAADG